MSGRVWIFGATFLSLFLLLGAPATAQMPQNSALQQPQQADVSGVVGLFFRGHLEHARGESTRRDDADGIFVRAMLKLREGEFEAARNLAEGALPMARTPEETARLTLALGQATWFLGDIKAAEKILRDGLTQRPQAHEVRIALGELLLERGAKAESDLILDAFSAFYNNGLLKTSVELAWLARAMELLGSYQDANRALEESIAADPTNVAALIQWGNLLLGKYNIGDAEVSFKEALEVEPNHPDALVGLARLEVENTNDYNGVQNLLETAELVEPQNLGIHVVRGRLAIYDTDYPRAREAAKKALSIRKNYLPAMTILAATDFLENKTEAFEKLAAEMLTINPRYAELFIETAEYLVRVYRYHEAVELDRRALKLIPGQPAALLGLGIGLSRTGFEDEGFDALRDAFDADPYNVRAFNMVELYEKVMPDYEFTEYKGFRLRASRQENDAINAIVAPVVTDAMTLYNKKYHHKPDPYLAVEVYPSAETFAVRSVGLPNVSPQGICFGRVVVSRSPSEGNFNWRQVVWHEMAHVYHIQVSHNRVPRWFTEGLAEYETNVKERGWQRHHDRELARALFAGSLRGVLDLDKGFTQARSFEEILRAYHQASLVIHYLVETHGFDKIVTMLQSWGKNQTSEQVYKGVLGVSPAEIDAGFKTWLGRRYLNFYGQLNVDLADIGSARDLEKKAAKTPNDGFVWAQLAVARVRDGDMPGSTAALDQALAMGTGDARVHYVAALLYFNQNRMKDSYAQGIAVLDTFKDSYDVRMLLGATSSALERLDEAAVHYHAATQLWGDGTEAWQALSRIAQTQKDDKMRERALSRLFDLDQHDSVIARQWWEWNMRKGSLPQAREAAERWIEISPFDRRAQFGVADVALKQGDDGRANTAYQAAIAVRASDMREVILEALKQGQSSKRKDFVEAWKKRAVEEKVPARLVDRVLKGEG